MTISQKYLEFISLVQALNTIVFGGDTAEVTLDGITKPSISKFLAQVDALTTAELQRLRDAINVVMNQQSVPTTIVTDGTHSQEWINSDFRAALQALNDWIDTKGLPNGYASLDANGTIPKAQLPNNAIPQATETALGVIELATQIETNTGTDDERAVTPEKMLNGVRSHLNASGGAPMYACRAWVNFNGTGTVTIRASGNVSSITDNGVGNYTINFTTAMPDSNYAVSYAAGVLGGGMHAGRIVSMAAGSINMYQEQDNSNSYPASDTAIATVAVFR